MKTTRLLLVCLCAQFTFTLGGDEFSKTDNASAAAKLQPGDLGIRANLARSLARAGNYGAAEAVYAGILKADPTNAAARLGEAEIDAWRDHDQQVLAAEKNNCVVSNRMEEASRMGASDVGVTAYQFKDTAHFLREDLEVDGRVHVTDRAYLLGDVAGWRFTSPGFPELDRQDAAVGLEYHLARWLEASAEGTVFDYDNTNSHAYYGGKLSTKISPVTGTDIYLTGDYNQPFVSSISTVEGSMRQHLIGLGLDTKLVNRFSFQSEVQAAKLSDDNHWWEGRPQLSYCLFDKPATFLRVQYDYLSYGRTNTAYWTPNNYHSFGPVLDTSLPICKGFHLDADAKGPYIFDQSKFGVQVEAGPVVDLFKNLQARVLYFYSSIPGDQGAWSGEGWRAFLQLRF